QAFLDPAGGPYQVSTGGFHSGAQDAAELGLGPRGDGHALESLRDAIDKANAPVVGIDVQGCIVEWNRKVAQICGWSKEDVLGKQLVETLVPYDSQDRVVEVLNAALQGSEVDSYELPLLDKAGKLHTLTLNAAMCVGVDGETTGVIGFGQDGSGPPVKNDQEATAAPDRVPQLADGATAPVLLLDSAGCVVGWSQGLAELTGYDQDGRAGACWAAVLPLPG
ncbi:unnamed protein product, partial [Prorocentrum cordatum]